MNRQQAKDEYEKEGAEESQVDEDEADFYEVLGVQPECSQIDIQSAYKRLALKYHPDKNAQEAKAVSMFILIRQAYETLKEKVSREQYDLGRRQWLLRQKEQKKKREQFEKERKRKCHDGHNSKQHKVAEEETAESVRGGKVQSSSTWRTWTWGHREQLRSQATQFSSGSHCHSESQGRHTCSEKPFHRRVADMWGAACGSCGECTHVDSPSTKKHKMFEAMFKTAPLIFGARVTTRRTGLVDSELLTKRHRHAR